MKDDKEKIKEIVIVLPDNVDEDEITIDLEELGIDLEDLDDEVNVIVQLESESDEIIDEDSSQEPNEWYFDDDPYRIVYYEFPEDEDEED